MLLLLCVLVPLHLQRPLRHFLSLLAFFQLLSEFFVFCVLLVDLTLQPLLESFVIFFMVGIRAFEFGIELFVVLLSLLFYQRLPLINQLFDLLFVMVHHFYLVCL